MIRNILSSLELPSVEMLSTILGDFLDAEFRQLMSANIREQKTKCVEKFSQMYSDFETTLEDALKNADKTDERNFEAVFDSIESKLEWKIEFRVDTSVWDDVRKEFEATLVSFTLK